MAAQSVALAVRTDGIDDALAETRAQVRAHRRVVRDRDHGDAQQLLTWMDSASHECSQLVSLLPGIAPQVTGLHVAPAISDVQWLRFTFPAHLVVPRLMAVKDDTGELGKALDEVLAVWVSKHRPIMHEDAEPIYGPPKPRNMKPACLKVGVCLCGPRGDSLWLLHRKFMTEIRKMIKEPHMKSLFTAGKVVLNVTPLPEHIWQDFVVGDFVDDDLVAEVLPSTGWVHVSLMYDLKPNVRALLWPDRRQHPVGRLHLHAEHVYYTLYEFLQERLDSMREEDIAGWKIQPFVLHESRRPLAFVDPCWIEVEKSADLQVASFSWGKPRGRGRGKAVDPWAKMLEDLSSEEEDEAAGAGDDDGGDDGGSAVASSIGGCSAEDMASLHEGSDSSSDVGSVHSVVLEDEAEVLRDAPDGADGVGDLPMEGSGGLPAAADAPGLAVLEVLVEEPPLADEPPPPAAKRARGGRATLELEIDGGTLRYYDATGSVVAHCNRHGSHVCRMTRTVRASRHAGRKGQGRPLGLLLAWLRAAGDPEHDSAELHKSMEPPSFEDRLEARVLFEADPSAAEWLAIERVPRPDEDVEPVAVP